MLYSVTAVVKKMLDRQKQKDAKDTTRWHCPECDERVVPEHFEKEGEAYLKCPRCGCSRRNR